MRTHHHQKKDDNPPDTKAAYNRITSVLDQQTLDERARLAV